MLLQIIKFLKRSVAWLPTLPANQQRALLFVVYTALIAGTFYWSGTVRDKTLYDIYTTRFDGVGLAVGDLNQSTLFYSSVLNFTRLQPIPGSELPVFRLPDNKKLFLTVRRQSAVVDVLQRALPNLTTIVIRVKANIDQLHKDFVNRNRKQPIPMQNESLLAASLPPASIGELVNHEWGREFVLSDPDGNRFLFIEGRRLHQDPYMGAVMLSAVSAQ